MKLMDDLHAIAYKNPTAEIFVWLVAHGSLIQGRLGSNISAPIRQRQMAGKAIDDLWPEGEIAMVQNPDDGPLDTYVIIDAEISCPPHVYDAPLLFVSRDAVGAYGVGRIDSVRNSFID